jgi:hypothetical protein
LAKEYDQQTKNFHNSEISKSAGLIFQVDRPRDEALFAGQRDRLF